MGEQEKTIRFGLRLPESLYNKLQERAREHQRSLNSQIIALLASGVQANQLLSQAEQMLSEAEQKINASEQRVDARARRLEERQKVQGAWLERLAAIVSAGGLQRWMVEERKNWAIGDLFDEAPQQSVNEEEPG
jgi:hypothetical protein